MVAEVDTNEREAAVFHFPELPVNDEVIAQCYLPGHLSSQRQCDQQWDNALHMPKIIKIRLGLKGMLSDCSPPSSAFRQQFLRAFVPSCAIPGHSANLPD